MSPTKKQIQALKAEGRDEHGAYCVPQLFCNKCHEPKTFEELHKNGPVKICATCIILEWRCQKIVISRLRADLRAAKKQSRSFRK